MTNKQTAALLKLLRLKLEAEIYEADATLGDNVVRVQNDKYIGNNRFGEFLSSPITHPNKWEKEDGLAVALTGLLAFTIEIEEIEEMLTSGTEDEDSA